jgi:hypothetical protein
MSKALTPEEYAKLYEKQGFNPNKVIARKNVGDTETIIHGGMPEEDIQGIIKQLEETGVL